MFYSRNAAGSEVGVGEKEKEMGGGGGAGLCRVSWFIIQGSLLKCNLLTLFLLSCSFGEILTLFYCLAFLTVCRY